MVKSQRRKKELKIECEAGGSDAPFGRSFHFFVIIIKLFAKQNSKNMKKLRNFSRYSGTGAFRDLPSRLLLTVAQSDGRGKDRRYKEGSNKKAKTTRGRKSRKKPNKD
eukprot:TRINITY_DN106519_c0_g1_i1.p2 TRINITY_DN106519_c0_g1~~TRINITY_DN106519_c0_g1_i1.p2  ORF type:complete len:108 (-),score=8.94 TRINITY_DN106519_c0_g1_i1:92-415(-)